MSTPVTPNHGPTAPHHGSPPKAIPSPMKQRAGVAPMNPTMLDGDDHPPASRPFVPQGNAQPFHPSGAGMPPLAPSPQQPPGEVSEGEFAHTHGMIPYVLQPALVNVMRSLIEDYPFLVPTVRMRCEQAMAQLHTPAGSMHNPRSPHYPDSGHPTPPNSNRKGSRRGSHREEEQEYCAVHGNMRSTKHLTYNPQARQYECIHGFHCLEQGGSNHVTPTKPRVAAPQQRSSPSGPLLPTGTPPPEPMGSNAVSNNNSPPQDEETRRLAALLSDLKHTQ